MIAAVFSLALPATGGPLFGNRVDCPLGSIMAAMHTHNYFVAVTATGVFGTMFACLMMGMQSMLAIAYLDCVVDSQYCFLLDHITGLPPLSSPFLPFPPLPSRIPPSLSFSPSSGVCTAQTQNGEQVP
jgi:hypothetical protein